MPLSVPTSNTTPASRSCLILFFFAGHLVLIDQDHAVRGRLAEQAVNEPAAHERFPLIGVSVRAAEHGEHQKDKKNGTL